MVKGGGHSLPAGVGEQVEGKLEEAAARQRRQGQTQRLLGLDVRR